MSSLEKILSPKDLKEKSYTDLYRLAEELRGKILTTVSHNGGHLASNLGIVETTIAMHRVFNSPEDQIIFDVGHQGYAHKLLTGRGPEFDSLRQWGGISGFTKRQESVYDPFGAGHCGTSISAGLGLAVANQLDGNDRYVIAIVGDGAFTNGMIYEALNNCTKNHLKLIIILNDNEMSISQNVGGLSRYLSRIRTSKKYFSLKHKTQSFFEGVPFIGQGLVNGTRKAKNRVKNFVVFENLFENLGIDYLGPIDGGDIKKIEMVLNEAKNKNECCLVHIQTIKGKGYKDAQNKPESYHSVSGFDLAKGVVKKKGTRNFSSVFGEILCEQARKNSKICGITAAMASGTGLGEFAKKYPTRFFDVGIAEEHAVTFGAGLAANDKLPVCAIYSTFVQRVYDQLIHDVAIQKLPMIMALDRCGLVPGDGVTHQGIYDCSYLTSVPGIEIISPETYHEMREAFDDGVSKQRFRVIRYPKGSELQYERTQFKVSTDLSYMDTTPEKKDLVIITYGRITQNAYLAIEKLKEDYSIRLIKLIKVFPLKMETIISLCDEATGIYILEEGLKIGGIGEKLAAEFAQNETMRTKKIVIRAIENPLVEQGDLESLYDAHHLSVEHIVAEIKDQFKK